MRRRREARFNPAGVKLSIPSPSKFISPSQKAQLARPPSRKSLSIDSSVFQRTGSVAGALVEICRAEMMARLVQDGLVVEVMDRRIADAGLWEEVEVAVVVVVVGSLQPNHPGVLHDVVELDDWLVVVGLVVVLVPSRQPHQPGVLQVSVRVRV